MYLTNDKVRTLLTAPFVRYLIAKWWENALALLEFRKMAEN